MTTNPTPKPDPTVCAACHRPRAKLYPYKSPHSPPEWAPALCCDPCIKACWRARKAYASLIDAAKWAERKSQDARDEAYYRTRYATEQYRGMIRTEPWPEVKRAPSFVWELKPYATLSTEYMRGFRYAKHNW